MLKKGERGGWDDPRAPRARTIRMCSLDGRSRDHPSYPFRWSSLPAAALREGARPSGQEPVLAGSGREGEKGAWSEWVQKGLFEHPGRVFPWDLDPNFSCGRALSSSPGSV